MVFLFGYEKTLIIDNMKKIEITITAPDVNIIAKVLKKLLKKYPGLEMEVSYDDDSVKKLMENQNEND